MKNSGSFFTNKLGETILKNSPILLSIIVVLMLAFGSWGQTYNWTGFPTTTNSSVVNFANGNMSAQVTAVSGGGSTGYSNGSTSQIGGSGVCAGTPTGLFLEMSGASSAWNNQINVAITFATSVCGPVTFTIYDINEAIWFDGNSGSSYSNYCDKVTIGATDQLTNPIAPANINYTSCAAAANISTSGNNKILRGNATSDGCSCNSATVTIGSVGQMIKTINILYNNQQPPTYAKYGICQFQNIVISPINSTSVIPSAITGPASACGGGSVTLTATGGNANTQWFTGSCGGTSAGPNGPTLTVSPVSTTTYYAQNVNCGVPTTCLSYVVPVNPNPTVSASASVTPCAGSPVTLTGSGASTYTWSNGLGSGVSVVASPLVNTTYTVTGTSAAGCSASNTVNVTVLAVPTVTASNSGPICSGSSVTLNTGGASTYAWSGGAGSGSSVSVSPASTTTYTVTGTAANGCIAANNTTVTVRPTPVISPTVNDASICSGTAINLSTNTTLSSSITMHDFESSNPFTLVNGTRNNWYRGTVAKCGGTYGLYIGTTSNGNNTYINYSSGLPRPVVSFAYLDIPITNCVATLSFDWWCQGKTTDYLSVWIVPTSFTPGYGNLTNELTTIGGKIEIGQYRGSSVCGTVSNIDLLQGGAVVGGTVRVVFQWRNAGSSTGANTPAPPAAMIDNVVISQTETNTYAWISNPSGFTSSSQNPTNSPTTSTTYTVTATGCNGCTKSATIGVVVDPCGLPIELTSFKGSCELLNRLFSWSTASEINNDYFVLEQSQNGNDFYAVGQMDGAGNSTSALNYSYKLKNEKGNYFRLKQVDFDGAFTYSDIIYVGCDDSDDQSIFFPNPFDDELNIDLSGIGERFSVAILDVNGRLIKSVVQGELKSMNAMKIDLSELAKGIYYIELLSIDTNDLLKKGKVVKL